MVQTHKRSGGTIGCKQECRLTQNAGRRLFQ